MPRITFDRNERKYVEATENVIKSFTNRTVLFTCRSRDSSVGIATGYGLDDQGAGVRVPVGSRIFISPYLPDRLCGPPNLL
jgi:hypothetical protein